MLCGFLSVSRCSWHSQAKEWLGLPQVDVEVARGILTRVLNSGEKQGEDEEAQEQAEGRDPDQASDEEGSSPKASTYAHLCNPCNLCCCCSCVLLLLLLLLLHATTAACCWEAPSYTPKLLFIQCLPVLNSLFLCTVLL